MNQIKIILIVIIILLFCFQSKSQLCGGGIYTLEIHYSINAKNLDISYEIYPTTLPDSLYRSISYFGNIIKADSAISIMDSVDCDFESNVVGEFGIVNNGKIEFRTEELGKVPYILKIITQDNEIFIIANLFGGCNRKNILFLTEAPRLEFESGYQW